MEDTDFAIIFSIIKWIVAIVFSLFFLAVVIMNLLPKGGQSNESAAIGNLRTVGGAQAAYKSLEGGYASTWKELHDDPIKAGETAYLDIDLSVEVQGYRFILKSAGDSLTGTNGTDVYTDFTCIAVPTKYQKGSKRSFYIDSTDVIRFEYGKNATIDSEPI